MFDVIVQIINFIVAFITILCEHFTVYLKIITCPCLDTSEISLVQHNKNYWSSTIFPVQEGERKTLCYPELCLDNVLVACTLLYNFCHLGFQVTQGGEGILSNIFKGFFFNSYF